MHELLLLEAPYEEITFVLMSEPFLSQLPHRWHFLMLFERASLKRLVLP